jgi:parvulin-like peptidyl-prolyl isomerase
MQRFILLFLVMAVFYVTCSKDQSKLEKGTPAYEFALKLSQKIPYLNPEENNPVVKTNGFEMKTGTVIKAIYDNMGKNSEQFYSLDSASLKNIVINNAKQLAEKEILLNAARKNGKPLAGVQMDSLTNQQYNRYGGKERFTQMLKQRGIDFNFVKKQIEESIIIQKYLDQVAEEQSHISDEDLLKLYNQGKTVTVRHILLSTQGKTDSEKVKIKKKMEELLARARAGEDFAELAKTYSEDPGSKDKGGLYEDFGRGQMVKPFEEAAFSVPVGEISDIIETTYGYHILKVIDRKPETRPFDEIKDQMRLQLENRNKNQAKQDLIEGLKKEANFTVVEFN